VSGLSGGRVGGARLCTLAAVLLVGLSYGAAGYYLATPQTFWSSDNSVRFVQLESLRTQGYRSLAAVYPAAVLDPGHEFYPIAEGFSYRRDGRVYLSYPWLFPLLAAPFYAWLGHPGLLVLPAACALAAVWAVAAAGSREEPVAGFLAALLVALASPLLVYAAVFWDHSLVAALTTGAAVLLLPGRAGGVEGRRALWAGFLLGLGPWFRNEAYLFAGAVLVALCAAGCGRSVARVLLGAAVPLLPLWAYHLWWFGHPLGYKGQALIQATAEPGLVGYLRTRVFVAYDALLSTEHYTRAFVPERVPEAAAAALILLVGAAFLRSGLTEESGVRVAVGGLLMTAVGAGLYALRLPVMGLLPSAPFVALSWVRSPADVKDRFLWTLASLYVAGVVAVGSVGGLQ